MWFYTVYLLVFLWPNLSKAQFVIPEVTVEAFTPKGFRFSIPAVTGIELVGFHINVNHHISRVEPGEYNMDVLRPDPKTGFSYYNPDVTLKIGDNLYYWIFVQFDGLGYRKDNQQFEVTELLKMNIDGKCSSTATKVANKATICLEDDVLVEHFKENITSAKWQIEQYIPYNGPDYEFNYYADYKDVCYIEKDHLVIQPKLLAKIRGELDLKYGCTKTHPDECYQQSDAGFILPPVASGRIVSKLKFRYGKVEIKAKLPRGDWIFPQIYLEEVRNPNRRLWIAYARGNERLVGKNDDDIGGKLLYGGPVLTPREPARGQYLLTKHSDKLFTENEHIFTVIWSKNGIELLVDDLSYGKIDKEQTNKIRFAENDYVQLVLGVGVGGVNDFPDGYTTGNNQSKPWSNNKRLQMKRFSLARDQWYNTWNIHDYALRVDHVKIRPV